MNAKLKIKKETSYVFSNINTIKTNIWINILDYIPIVRLYKKSP